MQELDLVSFQKEFNCLSINFRVVDCSDTVQYNGVVGKWLPARSGTLYYERLFTEKPPNTE